ncbi:hypothetical protein [Actinoplanes sp. NPDC089786]|uniref:hypothetical protein n=1 Tax=Actinoplanes sp. NPDC089786 TaxID=3155185 RepID=UPI0034442AD2
MAHTRRYLHVVVAMAAAMIVGSACSKAEPVKEAPKVATLASSGSSPAASTAAPERPRERLDTTPEEFEVMMQPYLACVREHGAKPKQDAKPGNPWTGADMTKLVAADKICGPLYNPLPPWEKDPSNPEAKDFARDVVKCLKEKGIQYAEVGDDGIYVSLGGDENDRESITNGMDVQPKCEREVAARRK